MSRKEKREAENKNRKIKFLTMMFIIIFLLSLIILITYFVKHKKENSDYLELSNFMTNVQENNLINDVIIPNEKIEKLRQLSDDNPDIVAWIEIEETQISYPVLQSNDNSYYLNHNYKKEYSETGSIFLDKDVDLKLPSSNFLMYGHRNVNGLMFEKLIDYQKEDFYNQHKYIKFITLDSEDTYEIIAVFRSRVYYKNETNVFRYYYFTNADNEKQYNDYVANAKKASLYDTRNNCKLRRATSNIINL